MLISISRSDPLNEETRTKYGKSITVAVRALKDLYEPNEPVPLVVAIANHGTKSIYVDKTEPYIEVKDANGIIVKGKPIPEPNAPVPPYYYMERNGKTIYTVPVFKIGDLDVMLELIPDALERYHKYLSEGSYFLRALITIGFYDESSLIFREDYPNQLWVEAKGGLPQLQLESNQIEVQIQGRTVEKEPLPQADLFAWPVFLGSIAAGIAAICLILLLKKKAISRSK